MLVNIGTLCFDGRWYEATLACFLLARDITEVRSSGHNKAQSFTEELHKKLGEEQFAALLARVEPRTSQIVEQTLHEGK